MKYTRANVAEWLASQAHLSDFEPYQIDGIPEGFSFIRRSMRNIGHIYDYGVIIAFTPGKDTCGNMPIILDNPDPTEQEIQGEIAKATEKLLQLYKKNIKA